MRKGIRCGAPTMALLVMGLAGCQINIPGLPSRAEADFDLSASADGITSLEIDWRNGDVQVTVDGTATQVEASGTKYANALGADPAESILAAIDIELAVDGSNSSTLVLTFDGPTAAMIGADVEVVLPASLALTVESTNGEIRVEGNEDATSVSLDNGRVIIDGQVGDCDVDVSNGRVAVTGEGGNVDVRVDAGDADIDAAPPADGTILARVDAGSVSIRVPAAFAASLDLSSDVGMVTTALDGFVVTDLQQSFRSASATLNGGGGSIVGRLSVGRIDFGALP